MACEKILEFEDCKDPDSNLSYSFTWKPWIDKENTVLVDDVANREIIVSLVNDADIDTNPLVVGVITVDVVNTIIYVWLTKGTVGLQYYITCKITAANGMTEDQTGILTCVEK